MSDDQKAAATLDAIALLKRKLSDCAGTAPTCVWGMLQRAQFYLEDQYARWLHGGTI